MTRSTEKDPLNGQAQRVVNGAIRLTLAGMMANEHEGGKITQVPLLNVQSCRRRRLERRRGWFFNQMRVTERGGLFLYFAISSVI